jgi:NAD(P)-dependent dehydrogenase (short-subunit alcohol dehydrogenase family)
MGKLSGKVAAITGATSGIGLATARLFVQEGAHVFITGRRQSQLDTAVAGIGDGATGVQGDAGDLADLDRLMEAVRTTQGHLDILFISAGLGDLRTPLGAITEEAFDRVFRVNVRGAVFTAQKALPLLRDGGSIILNASIAGVKGMPGTSIYSASKAAVRSFARTWTMDLKSRGIRVNAISPGPIETAIFDTIPAGEREELKAQMVALVPLGRMGQAGEIARAALFLASSDSSFITGAELFVDGGWAQV